MDNEFFRKIVTVVILAALLLLSFLILRPILLSIIVGLILVVVFAPVYNRLLLILKSKNLTAALIIAFLILLILLPLAFLIPIFIEQSFEVYRASQKLDFVAIMQNIFPSLFASDAFSAEIGSILNSFVTKSANAFVNSLSQLILNFPTFLLHLLIVFSTFFFVLRDKEGLLSYIKSLMPFSEDVENKLFKSSKDITLSVVYGQVVIGVIQGLLVGFGFFIFKVPNALFLTLLASLAGIFPIIGTTIVWLPVVIFLFVAGNNFSAVGVTVFGFISSFIDNVVRPILVSKRTRMHPLLMLIGMIGGLFFFGILGFILGPLIIAYVLIVLEIYRGKAIKGIFISQEK